MGLPDLSARNVFADLPQRLEAELIEKLLDTDSLSVERIVSRGQASPEGFWYDQDTHEWVILLSGCARLLLEGGKAITLGPGDYLNIPAGRKHRVEWTAPDENTVWLAIHY